MAWLEADEVSFLKDFDSIPCTGPWPYALFSSHILATAAEHGDDFALASMMNCFPRLDFENAQLWLAYMRQCRRLAEPSSEYIMNTFRRFDWYQVLSKAHGTALAVSPYASIDMLRSWNPRHLARAFDSSADFATGG